MQIVVILISLSHSHIVNLLSIVALAPRRKYPRHLNQISNPALLISVDLYNRPPPTFGNKFVIMQDN